MNNLDESIAAALAAEPCSKVLMPLQERVHAAIGEAEASEQEARRKALSPRTLGDELVAARKEMDEAAFRRDRLREASSELQVCLKLAEDREREIREDAEYEAAIAERDALAKDLAQYPELAGKILDLLLRLEASNRRMAAAAGKDRGDRLSAEDIARPVVAAPGASRSSLMNQIILPTMERSSVHLWPPRHLTANHLFLLG